MSSRRTRGRGNVRGRPQNIRSQQMDSSGPSGRIRGVPQQILDRYLALARDATSAGDTILSENFSQHAEHYARLLNASQPQSQQGQSQQHSANGPDDGMDDYSNEAAEASNVSNHHQAPTLAPVFDASADPGAGEQPNVDAPWVAPTAAPATSSVPVEGAASSSFSRRRRGRFQRQTEGGQPASDGNEETAPGNGHAGPVGGAAPTLNAPVSAVTESTAAQQPLPFAATVAQPPVDSSSEPAGD